MGIEYKSLSSDDYEKILTDLESRAEQLIRGSLPLKEYRYEYGRLKDDLREIYHYVTLQRNDPMLLKRNEYAMFAEAIIDAHIHVYAKRNASRDEIALSLCDIEYYCDYGLHNLQRKEITYDNGSEKNS